MAGSELLCFLNAYSGYHQIRMKESDKVKTSFITPFGAFCFVMIPFGLKNAGATYQRTMQRCLHDQLGRNVHAYVDDTTVMSKNKETLIFDLEERSPIYENTTSCLTRRNASLEYQSENC